MKKVFYILVSVILVIPLISTEALTCRNGSDTVIDPKSVVNFSCSDVKGENLTFFHGETDYGKYFSTVKNSNGTVQVNINSDIVFEPDLDVGVVTISDEANPDKKENTFSIKIKNLAYVPTTTTTTTTTTADANVITYTVTLDLNDNTSEKMTRTCSVNSLNTNCIVTLPNLERTDFNGWGTARTCKEGSSGSVRVDKDITYYACYTTNTAQVVDKLALKDLNIKNPDNEEDINFGKFSKDKDTYTFSVLYDVENLYINATPEDSNTKVSIAGNENLIVGENKIVITLSNLTETKEYVLNVTRLHEGETIDLNNYLSSLVIGGYSLNFDKKVFDYSLTIDQNIDKLEITAIPENETDEVNILNNSNLTNGSIVLINVVSENGDSTTYRIAITKDSNFFLLIIIAIAILMLLIIIFIIIVILKNKKNNNNKNNINSKKEQKNKKVTKTSKNNNGPELLSDDEDIEVFKI